MTSNNFKSPKTQDQLAKEMGMTVQTLRNYKMLADMIPKIISVSNYWYCNKGTNVPI